MSGSPVRRSALRKFAFGAVAWALALAVIEGILAASEPLWARDADEAVPLSRRDQERAGDVLLGARDQRAMGDTLRFHVRSNLLTQHDADLLFRVAPNPSGEPVHDYTGINTQGFRGRPLEAPPPGTRSILLLGDSCGFGWGIHEYDQTIAARLEQIFAQLATRTGAEHGARAVFNLSQPGYSSEQARRLFERWSPTLEPDLVIAYLGWNDLFRSGSEDRDTLERLRIANAPGLRLARSTHLYRAIEAAVDALRGEPDAVSHRGTSAASDRVRRVSAERSIENLRAIANDVAARGGHLVIIPPPALEWMDTSGMPEHIDSLRSALAEVALFLELPEMAPSAPGHESMFLRDGFHPNARGASYIAQQLARADLALVRAKPAGTPAAGAN